MKEYKEAIRYLYSLQKYGIKFGLSCTKNLLKVFGNPHISQNYVHIAGTNGKGSVANFISSILKEAGYKVGLYTSPHLVRFTERIQINFKEISFYEVVELVKELKKAVVLDQPPTFFEAVTAMALKYFSEKNTDISIIEVGMGGRLDATNIIKPLVSIITNVSYDHEQFLGNSLKEIAYEKAGIIKKGVPVVTGVENEEALDVIKDACKKNNAKLYVIGKDFGFEITDKGFVYKGILGELKDLEISLFGIHQYKNASIALAALEVLTELGWNIKPAHVYQGLKKVKWPGRMYVLSNNPLIVLDGAHNPEAMKKLKESIQTEFSYDRIFLVIGIMEDKNISDMLKEILKIANYAIFSKPKYSRAADPKILMDLSDGFKGKKEIITPLSKAVDKAISLASNKDLVLICGSLFTVGEALSYLKPDEFKPDI